MEYGEVYLALAEGNWSFETCLILDSVVVAAFATSFPSCGIISGSRHRVIYHLTNTATLKDYTIFTRTYFSTLISAFELNLDN